MIFRLTFKLIKYAIIAFLIVLLLGYPLAIHNANPFVFYYDQINEIVQSIKLIKDCTLNYQ